MLKFLCLLLDLLKYQGSQNTGHRGDLGSLQRAKKWGGDLKQSCAEALLFFEQKFYKSIRHGNCCWKFSTGQKTNESQKFCKHVRFQNAHKKESVHKGDVSSLLGVQTASLRQAARSNGATKQTTSGPQTSNQHTKYNKPKQILYSSNKCDKMR